MNYKSLIILLIILPIVASALFGCTVQATPPTFEEIEIIFNDHKEYFIAINNYCTNTTVTDFSVDTHTKDSTGELNTEIIKDDAAKNAINKLISQGTLKQVYKYGDTIVYILWESSFDEGCGIAYSATTPKIAFMTELESLTEENWYYYVDDYNTWRLNN